MYQPSKNLLQIIRNAFPLQLFPWDHYFPTMAETDWQAGRQDLIAVKSFFIRKAPFGGSYAVLAGITEALRTINDLRFNKEGFQCGMADMGFFPGFCNWLLRRERLKLKIWSPPEGAIFFPNEPIVSIQGPLADVRLAEGIIIEALNFASLCATKWSRIINVTSPWPVLEFGRRRAQNSLKASLYSILMGAKGTSNSELRRYADVDFTGTVGHEWYQSFPSLEQAFETWLTHRPDKPIALVDTIDCMAKDFPLWLDTVYKFRDAIKDVDPPNWGWRNDSGDLAALTIEQYLAFLDHPLARDAWFKERLRIILTSDLDEYACEDIRSQISCWGTTGYHILNRIVWAVGTRGVTCYDQPALNGVMKLMEVESVPCIKLAYDTEGKPGVKTSIPGFNRSGLILDYDDDNCIAAAIVYPEHRYATLFEEGTGYRLSDQRDPKLEVSAGVTLGGETKKFPFCGFVPQQRLVYDSLEDDGFTADWENPVIKSVQRRVGTCLKHLSKETKELNKPKGVPVLLTPDLFNQRQHMIEIGSLMTDWID